MGWIALIHPSRKDRMRIARQFIAGNDEPPTRTRPAGTNGIATRISYKKGIFCPAGTNGNSPAIHCRLERSENMQITINDNIGEKIRLLPNPEVFVNSVLEQALLEREKTIKNLKQAAHALLNDYENDPELTAFTALDPEADSPVP